MRNGLPVGVLDERHEANVQLVDGVQDEVHIALLLLLRCCCCRCCFGGGGCGFGAGGGGSDFGGNCLHGLDGENGRGGGGQVGEHGEYARLDVGLAQLLGKERAEASERVAVRVRHEHGVHLLQHAHERPEAGRNALGAAVDEQRVAVEREQARVALAAREHVEHGPVELEHVAARAPIDRLAEQLTDRLLVQVVLQLGDERVEELTLGRRRRRRLDGAARPEALGRGALPQTVVLQQAAAHVQHGGGGGVGGLQRSLHALLVQNGEQVVAREHAVLQVPVAERVVVEAFW